MRVLPLEPFGGDASDHEAGSARWNGATVSAVREAAVKLLPFKLNDVVWREDPELGPVGVGRARRGEVRVLVLVAELDAPRFVAGLERVARTLPEELVEQASLVVLTERVTPDVQGAVALVGPGIARVFLVEFDASESGAPKGSAAAKASGAATADAARADVPVAQVALPDAPVPAVVVAEVAVPDEAHETPEAPEDATEEAPDETPSGGSHLTSARGRRRGRPAVPALAPSEQLGVVAGLVGEAELHPGRHRGADPRSAEPGRSHRGRWTPVRRSARGCPRAGPRGLRRVGRLALRCRRALPRGGPRGGAQPPAARPASGPPPRRPPLILPPRTRA
ncbi:hypothetical protein [Salana multivorans]